MNEIKQVTLRLNQNLYDEIKKLAESECRPVSQQIEYMLKKYIEIRR